VVLPNAGICSNNAPDGLFEPAWWAGRRSRLLWQCAGQFGFADDAGLGFGAANLGDLAAGDSLGGSGGGGGSLRNRVSRSRNIWVRSDPIRRSIAQPLSTQLAIKNHVIFSSPSVICHREVYIGVLCLGSIGATPLSGFGMEEEGLRSLNAGLRAISAGRGFLGASGIIEQVISHLANIHAPARPDLSNPLDTQAAGGLLANAVFRRKTGKHCVMAPDTIAREVGSEILLPLEICAPEWIRPQWRVT
jgi:hypothetical protein